MRGISAARAAYEANRFEAAVSNFNRALRTGPPRSRVYEGLGLAYEALGRYDDAEHAYRDAIPLGGSAYRPPFVLGRFLFKQGRAAESLPYLEAALRLSPSAAEVRFEFGRALYELGKSTAAEEVLVQGTPTRDCRVYNLLAKVLRQRGDAAAADNQLEEWKHCAANQN